MHGSNGLTADKRLSPFEVFGDYAPLQGGRVLVRVGPLSEAHDALVEKRANEHETLDPALAQGYLRAGLSLVRASGVSFAWASPEEALVLLREPVGATQGTAVSMCNQLLSMFSARLSLILGHEVPLESRLYELPDLAVVRKAVAAIVEDVEENTPLRSSLWLGAQLRGRGQPFHPSMIESLEEQSSLLQTNGIDMDALPSWWWRGMAATRDEGGAVSVIDELPSGEALARLVEA